MLDLDTVSRLAALRPELLPVLVLFDFANAFPSVFHAWVFAVLNFVQAPLGFRNLVKGLYHNNVAYIKTESGFTKLFIILSGVLQGCPLSGSLFTMAIDPFFRQTYNSIDIP